MELHPPIYLADLVCIYLKICSKFQLHYSCFGVLKTKHPIASGGAVPPDSCFKDPPPYFDPPSGNPGSAPGSCYVCPDLQQSAIVYRNIV